MADKYKTPECRQADVFAKELLMPKVAVDYFLQEKKMTNVKELADRFAVSPRLMRERLVDLGWL